MTSIDDLLAIMAQLRDPTRGCPWDREQSFATIAPHTIEEAYEVADAIARGDLDELREELGDLLFQVVFYAQMAREQGAFDFDDVVQGICTKMLRRHPHVFDDADYSSEQALHQAWEQAKSQERLQKQRGGEPPSHLAGVAKALPALLRAEKLQRRAARVGFDWPEVGGALAKCHEELTEVELALVQPGRAQLAEELGDFLFAAVNLTRLSGVDAEQVLRRANDKFESRFRRMEARLREQGSWPLEEQTLATLDAAWEAVKADERSNSNA